MVLLFFLNITFADSLLQFVEDAWFFGLRISALACLLPICITGYRPYYDYEIRMFRPFRFLTVSHSWFKIQKPCFNNIRAPFTQLYYIYTYIYTYIYICMYVCIYVCIYMYMKWPQDKQASFKRRQVTLGRIVHMELIATQVSNFILTPWPSKFHRGSWNVYLLHSVGVCGWFSHLYIYK